MLSLGKDKGTKSCLDSPVDSYRFCVNCVLNRESHCESYDFDNHAELF